LGGRNGGYETITGITGVDVDGFGCGDKGDGVDEGVVV